MDKTNLELKLIELLKPNILSNLDKNKVITKWGSIGFLDGIKNKKLEKIIATCYEIASKYFLNTQFDDDIINMTFPLIRKLLNEGKILKVRDSNEIVFYWVMLVIYNLKDVIENCNCRDELSFNKEEKIIKMVIKKIKK